MHWTERLFREQADSYVPFFEERYEAADREAERVLALADETFGADPATALDLACGAGRHVLAFADRGLDAEGVDFSERFVAEARERAADRGLADRATVRHGDVRNLDEWDGSYDLVTSFWNSLGYYGRETDLRVLTEANRLLSETGVLAVEIGNKDWTVANLEPASVHEGDRLFVERREYDPATGRFSHRLDLFDPDGYEHEETMEWEFRMYAPAALRDLLTDAGFEAVHLFGGFDGGELTMEDDTVVALAR